MATAGSPAALASTQEVRTIIPVYTMGRPRLRELIRSCLRLYKQLISAGVRIHTQVIYSKGCSFCHNALQLLHLKMNLRWVETFEMAV